MERMGWTLAAAGVATVLAAVPALGQCDDFTWQTGSRATGSSPRAAAFGDVDGDLDLDLIVADTLDDTVSVLPGVPGGFGAPLAFPAGSEPRGVAVGDLDGNGTLDVAVADWGWLDATGFHGFGLSVLWNGGGGALSAPVLFALPPGEVQPTDVALGDLDGDGDLDAVLTLRSSGSFLYSKVASFLNLGGKAFAPPVLAQTGYDPVALDLGDLDGDGDLDAVTANWTSGTFSRLLGAGDGSFGIGFSYSIGSHPTDVALGDFDGDGDPDAVVPYQFGIHVLRDDAGAFTWLATLPVALIAAGVELADLDGDGALDLAAANQFSDALDLWLGDGAGGFAYRAAVAAGDGPYAVTAADADLDGDVDLAAPLISAGGVAWFLNECPLSTYCAGKVNSAGCTPAMGWAGSPSLGGPDDFHVVATQELNHKPGLIFFGLAPRALPWFGGTRCVAQPILRTPLQMSGGNAGPPDCSGSYDFHVSHAWVSAHGWVAGVELFAQAWSRDPQQADGTTIALGNALRFTLQP
jgi:hypothetical protein